MGLQKHILLPVPVDLLTFLQTAAYKLLHVWKPLGILACLFLNPVKQFD